jgi:hypothetical protein
MTIPEPSRQTVHTRKLVNEIITYLIIVAAGFVLMLIGPIESWYGMAVFAVTMAAIMLFFFNVLQLLYIGVLWLIRTLRSIL